MNRKQPDKAARPQDGGRGAFSSVSYVSIQEVSRKLTDLLEGRANGLREQKEQESKTRTQLKECSPVPGQAPLTASAQPSQNLLG